MKDHLMTSMQTIFLLTVPILAISLCVPNNLIATKDLALQKRIAALEKEIDDIRLHEESLHKKMKKTDNSSNTVILNSASSKSDIKTPIVSPHKPALQNVSITEEPLPTQMLSNDNHVQKENDAIPQEAPTQSIESEHYQQARHYLSQQRLDLAKPLFEEIIKKYQDTPEAILAHFWVGEIMSQHHNFAGASIAYGQAYGVLKSLRKNKVNSTFNFHGEEERLQEILYKLAIALKKIKKRQDACLALKQLSKDMRSAKETPPTLKILKVRLQKELRCR